MLLKISKDVIKGQPSRIRSPDVWSSSSKSTTGRRRQANKEAKAPSISPTVDVVVEVLFQLDESWFSGVGGGEVLRSFWDPSPTPIRRQPKMSACFFLILQLLLFCCVLGFLCGENKGREGDKAPSLAEGKNDQATQHTKWAKDVADFYNMLPRHEGPATKSFPPSAPNTNTNMEKLYPRGKTTNTQTERETCSG